VKLSRALQVLGGITLTLAGLLIFFQKVNIHKLGEDLLSLNPLTVICCGLGGIMTLVFRAWRWKIMLPESENASKNGLFPIVSIGFMLNNILPARLGEAARIVLLWKKNGYAPALCIGSIILERIFDTLAFMSCFFIPVLLLGSMKSTRLSGAIAGKVLTLQTFAFLFGFIFLFACLIVFLYSQFPSHSRLVAKKLLQFVPGTQRSRVKTMGSEVISNLNWIFSLKKVTLVIIYN
jgi:uncharacterized protein (TIRG00374 family)